MAQAGKSPARRVNLLIATRKGLWQLHGDTTRRAWRLAGPQFLGHIVHHCVADPRDAQDDARGGAHRTPRSDDFSLDAIGAAAGTRRKQPPAFSEGSARTVDHTFWLTPGHAASRASGTRGTSPQGLFRSEDGGATWRGVAGFNEHPQRKAWCGGDQDGTPDGPKLHSILIDPRDARAPVHRHVERRRIRIARTAAPTGTR